MTLTEFLLDRIAEDRARARAVPLAGIRLERDAPQSVVGFVIYNDPARVLAECAAKIRAIEAVTYYARYLGEIDLENDTLRALASTYAGHPDFRDEWRG